MKREADLIYYGTDMKLVDVRSSESKLVGDYEEDKAEMDYLIELNRKYKPRKPKYCNKLLTSYSWNRYNKTHYDIDSPPPKTILGYQFNIDYRELIDHNTIPTYSVHQLDNDPGFAMLKFSAGPPYEDIAFKILDGEWNCSYKHGYKCQIRKGVLELWFKYKRLSYRR